MKLLLTSNKCENIYEKSSLLKSKGIAVYLSDQGMVGIKTGVDVGLWVVIDSQFDDANALLLNPKHLVANPLSEEEMLNLDMNAKANLSLSTERVFNICMLVIVLVLAIFIVIKAF